MLKIKLFDEVEVHRKPPINYADIKGKERFILPKDQLPAVYLCELKNAVVSPYGVVYHHFKVVPESVFHTFGKQNHYPTLIKKIVFNKIRKENGLCIVATHAYYSNYYHFTTECLPRPFVTRQYAQEAKLLLHEYTPRFAMEYCKLLGYQNIVHVKDTELVRSENLLFCTHFSCKDTHSHNPGILHEVVRFLKDKTSAIRAAFSDFRNVYISRRKATSRKLVNEAEVIALLKQYDFRVVYLEDYSVAEQIALFSNVRNLVAVHGAGTTNLMFMPQGGLVVELINEAHHAPFFYTMANVFDHDTIYIQGAATPQPRDPIRDNFVIDIPSLKHHLDNHLKSGSLRPFCGTTNESMN